MIFYNYVNPEEVLFRLTYIHFFYICIVNNLINLRIKPRIKMISKKIQEALNKQINAEFYSSYFYLSMSAYFESMDLQGFQSGSEFRQMRNMHTP